MRAGAAAESGEYFLNSLFKIVLHLVRVAWDSGFRNTDYRREILREVEGGACWFVVGSDGGH